MLNESHIEILAIGFDGLKTVKTAWVVEHGSWGNKPENTHEIKTCKYDKLVLKNDQNGMILKEKQTKSTERAVY